MNPGANRKHFHFVIWPPEGLPEAVVVENQWLPIVGRLADEVRAVVHVPQSVEDIGVDAILDVVDGSVGKDSIDAGRVGRAKLKLIRPTDCPPRWAQGFANWNSLQAD